MADFYGMTNEQRNKQYLQEMAERSAERQKASAERFQKLSNGFGERMAKNYDLSEMTATANGFLDGSINPKELGVERCNEFTNQCNSVISELEKKLQNVKTSAGLAYVQNRLDSYKKQKQEIDDIESKITLFKNFI